MRSSFSLLLNSSILNSSPHLPLTFQVSNPICMSSRLLLPTAYCLLPTLLKVGLRGLEPMTLPVETTEDALVQFLSFKIFPSNSFV
jgi:hypothetical protein